MAPTRISNTLDCNFVEGMKMWLSYQPKSGMELGFSGHFCFNSQGHHYHHDVLLAAQ